MSICSGLAAILNANVLLAAITYCEEALIEAFDIATSP